jgi:hypothetical protein
MGRGLNPGRSEGLLSKTSRPAQGPTQIPIPRAPEFFPRHKVARA